jgi:hypothetical protein
MCLRETEVALLLVLFSGFHGCSCGCLLLLLLQMPNISLLVFDEAHHCNSDHPYAQIMEDFYHTLEPQHRPQVLGFTASPKGLEGADDWGIGASNRSRKKKGKSKGSGGAAVGGGKWGLQQRLDARLVTVAGHLR